MNNAGMKNSRRSANPGALNWQNLYTLFNYPQDTRKSIYTTNAIESLNNVVRKAIKKRKLFPTDDSARKVIYLATQKASKKWSALIGFEERLTDYI